VLSVVLTVAHARPSETPDCRKAVFHPSCRGVAGRSGRSSLGGIRAGRELKRFINAYFTERSEARRLRALEHYLSPKRPRHVSEQQTASLLDRLLRTDPAEEDDYSLDYDI